MKNELSDNFAIGTKKDKINAVIDIVGYTMFQEASNWSQYGSSHEDIEATLRNRDPETVFYDQITNKIADSLLNVGLDDSEENITKVYDAAIESTLRDLKEKPPLGCDETISYVRT